MLIMDIFKIVNGKLLCHLVADLFLNIDLRFDCNIFSQMTEYKRSTRSPKKLNLDYFY